MREGRTSAPSHVQHRKCMCRLLSRFYLISVPQTIAGSEIKQKLRDKYHLLIYMLVPPRLSVTPHHRFMDVQNMVQYSMQTQGALLDVLSRIFLYSVPIYTKVTEIPPPSLCQAPLTISHVCRTWRHIALTTPSL